MTKLNKIFVVLVAALLLGSTNIANAENLVVEPPERTIFTSQTLPVLVYTEPIASSADTTDVDVTLIVTEADLTSIKKITLAAKVSRREDSSVQLVPATESEPAKRIITEKLRYAGKIKANKLIMSVFLKAIYAGEFTVSSGSAVGNYTIQGTTRTQPPLGDGDADVPAAITSAPAVATASTASPASVVASPGASSDSAELGDVVGASDNSTDSTTIVSTNSSSANEVKCTQDNNSVVSNDVWWIVLWVLSLLAVLFLGYFVGKRERSVN